MVIEFTDEQNKIIDKKFENPSMIVMCPICNTELQYFKFGNSVQVKCGTPGCVDCSIRGI